MSMRGSAGIIGRRLWRAILILTALFLPGNRVAAQVLPATAGAVGGFFAGTLVMTGTVVLEARLGKYVYGLDDFLTLRPETIPLILFPVAGVVLGATSPATLGRAAKGALIGLAGGAVLGTGIGHILWSTSEGRWAGGIIGSAAGMVAGAIIYSIRSPTDDRGASVPLASVSLKVPWGR